MTCIPDGVICLTIATNSKGEVVPYEEASHYIVVKLYRGELISKETMAGDLDSARDLYEKLETCSCVVASGINKHNQASFLNEGIETIVTNFQCVDEVINAKLQDRLRNN